MRAKWFVLLCGLVVAMASSSAFAMASKHSGKGSLQSSKTCCEAKKAAGKCPAVTNADGCPAAKSCPAGCTKACCAAKKAAGDCPKAKATSDCSAKPSCDAKKTAGECTAKKE